MAAKDKPFRLMDLAPELRTRVYECFFEPEGPQTISIFDITKHAPSQAITAVSKLVRHETYQIGKDAEREFFQRSFFLEWHNDGRNDEENHNTQVLNMCELISQLPCFPITMLEVRLAAAEGMNLHLTRNTEWTRHRISVDSKGVISQMVQYGWGDDFENGKRDEMRTIDMSLVRSVQVHGEPLIRSGDPTYLDVLNVVETVLLARGWLDAPGCPRAL
ncbi:hypothetical protein LTR10_000030 [Elasticomyces elasticus]|nr:hypothetical protein LTR10_000030 [Elasticomyces elasticus]KAK4980711.1 hypothetical protein LTR42_001020 [Elasticomyces elasticus]